MSLISAVLHITAEYIADAAVAQQTPSIAANGAVSVGVEWFALAAAIPGWINSTPFAKTTFTLNLQTTGEPLFHFTHPADYTIIFDIFQGVNNPNQTGEFRIYEVYVVANYEFGELWLSPTSAEIVGSAKNALHDLKYTNSAYNYVEAAGDAIDGFPSSYATIFRDPIHAPLLDYPNLKVSSFNFFIGYPGDDDESTITAWLIINEPDTGFTDRSDYLYRGAGGGHNWSQPIRKRGQASIDLVIPDGDEYSATRGSQVFLFDQTADGTFLMFSGLIQDITERWVGTKGNHRQILTAVSFESVFDTVYTDSVQYVNKTCGYIVKDIFYRLEVGCPVGLGTVSDGATIPLFNTRKGDKISQIFDQLATTSQFIWNVNPSKLRLFFGAPSSLPARFDIGDAEMLQADLEWKQSGADYRNRQGVRLSFDAFEHSKEYFVGAGQTEFTLSRPLQQVTNAYVTLSTCNTSTGTFSGNPSAGDTVTIGPAAGARQGSHLYALAGVIIVNGYVQKVTFAGTTASSAPTFSIITGGTTTDGTVIWTCQGTAGLSTGQETYTFVSSLDNTQFGQVLIGSTSTDTCLNLIDAINANADVRGATFSLPTWECSQCNAISNAGTHFTLQQKSAGTGWVSDISATGSAFSWSGAHTSGGTSPQGSVGPGEGATISLQVYVEGTSTAAPALAYTPGASTVRLATPLNVGTNLNVEYTRADGDVIEVEDTDLVTALAAITHGTGKYQQMADVSTQGLISTSRSAALQLAQEALASYSVAPSSVVFKTYKPGLQAGMTLTVALTLPTGGTALLNGDWVIEEISAELRTVKPPYGYLEGHYLYTVRLINIQEIGSYLDFWEGVSGGGTGGGSGAALVATSGGALDPVTAAGTVTHTVAALAAHKVVVGNGSDDVETISGAGSAGQYLRSGGASADPAMASIAESEVTNLVSDLALKAPLASPTFTGTPAAPTPSTADSSTKLATTAYVQAQGYAPLASPALTGSPTAPTATAADSSTKIATTAFVQGEITAKAPLASPTFTGDPKAPTPSPGDNDTSIATTAFVTGAVDAAVAGIVTGGAGTGFGFGGDGSDGPLDLDGTNTYAGIVTTTGSAPNRAYTLARDIYPTTLIVEASKILITANFRIFAQTSVTVNGTVHNNAANGGNGGNASASSAGSAGAGGNHGTGNFTQVSILNSYNNVASPAGVIGRVGGTGAGLTGTSGNSNANGRSAGQSLALQSTGARTGQQGGAGGAAGATAGGNAGTAGTALGDTLDWQSPRDPTYGLTLRRFNSLSTATTFTSISGDGGGSSGGAGAGDATNSGGGSGGSGGSGGGGEPVVIASPTIIIGAAGVIGSNGGTGGNGGNGGQGATGNVGGGGGGAGGNGGQGGIVVLCYHSIANSGTIQAAGGTKGTGGSLGAGRGTGSNGVGGSNGLDGQAGIIVQIAI